MGRLREIVRVEERVARWVLGGLLVALVVTGAVLLGYYRPPEAYFRPSYDDMKYLEFDVPFGMLVRNLHRGATGWLLLAAWLHVGFVIAARIAARVRRVELEPLGWLSAGALAACVVGLSVTGYLVPWDQLSIAALTAGRRMAQATPLLGHEGPFADLVGANARYDARSFLTAGQIVGGATLTRFYVLHALLLPISTAALMILHFRRARPMPALEASHG